MEQLSKDFDTTTAKKFHLYFGHLTDQNGKRVKPDEIVKWFDQEKKKEAIAFRNWCLQNAWGGTTTEQLYDIYKQPVPHAT